MGLEGGGHAPSSPSNASDQPRDRARRQSEHYPHPEPGDPTSDEHHVPAESNGADALLASGQQCRQRRLDGSLHVDRRSHQGQVEEDGGHEERGAQVERAGRAGSWGRRDVLYRCDRRLGRP